MTIKLNPTIIRDSFVNNALTSNEPKVSKFRQALPQILACMAKNLLFFDLGLAFGFPTIVIPVLRGFSNDRNPHEMLHFTAEQSSWYGSIALMTQPLAGLLSGWLTDSLGRRRTMILVNIPHIVAWLLLYRATTTAEIYVAGCLLGLGVGLMETSVLTYVGEVSHQSLRGTLLAMSTLTGMLGISSMYLLGALAAWRQVALMCLAVPIAALLIILLIPETPYWLMTRDRNADAMKSLQWLRGWVSAAHVQTEYNELRQYVTKSMACGRCKRMSAPCLHTTGFWTRSLEIVQPNTSRPMAIVAMCFMLSLSCNLSAVQPFLVQVLTVFRVPMDANYVSVMMGYTQLAAHIVLLPVVKCVGKRRLFLLSSGIAVICVLGLTLNAFCILPSGASSFDREFVLSSASGVSDNVLALVLFMLQAFFSGMAVGFPWMFLCEVYPTRVRAMACGISSSFCYVLLFTTTKSYLLLEQTLSIGGVLLFYFVVALIVWIAAYNILPETEGRTLEAIEAHFSKKQHRMTDRTIPITVYSTRL